MKKIYFIAAMSGLLLTTACNDDERTPGNPVIDVKTEIVDAYFGDSLAFTVNASDVDVPLSTLKAQLYFGEEMVSEKVIRTTVAGLAEAATREGVTKTALITVGGFLGDEYDRSKLYDPTFTTGFREASN